MMLLLHIHRFAKIPHFALCGYAGCTKNQLLFVMTTDPSFSFQSLLFACEILVSQRVMMVIMR
jgi:hypothetical protein